MTKDYLVWKMREGTEYVTDIEKRGEFLGTFVQIVNQGASSYKVVYLTKDGRLQTEHIGKVILG